MKWKCGNSRRAMTRIEVVAVIAVFGLLVAVLLPKALNMRRNVQRSTCLSNLRDVASAFRQFAIDYTNYPMALSTNIGGTKEYAQLGDVFRHFQALSNDLPSPKYLVCPSDVRRPAKNFASMGNSNISYFVGLDATETHPRMFLLGDRNLTNGTLLPNGILDLRSNSVVGWSRQMHNRHNRDGNIALADGSIFGLSSVQLRESLSETGVATNRLALPW